MMSNWKGFNYHKNTPIQIDLFWVIKLLQIIILYCEDPQIYIFSTLTGGQKVSSYFRSLKVVDNKSGYKGEIVT